MNSPLSGHAPQHDIRGTKDGPFCWQTKGALRRIREAFDRTNDVASGLGVYLALAEIASDSGAERFVTTHAWIQRLSGWSIRTIQARLKTLTEIGLIEVQTPGLRGPSTYCLKAVRQPLPDDTQPLPNVRQLAKRASLPTSEESTEESTKETPKKLFGPKAAKTQRLSEWRQMTGDQRWQAVLDWTKGARLSGADYTDQEARFAYALLEASGWRVGARRMDRDWRLAVERQIQQDRRFAPNHRRPTGTVDRNAGTCQRPSRYKGL